MRGTGVGEPEGYLNCPAFINVNRNAANSIRLVDVTGMIARLLPGSMGRAVWIASVTAIPQLTALADAAGNTVWINVGTGAQTTMPGTLFGRPVIFSEYASALGTRGDLSLIDPKAYLEGQRSGVEIAVSKDFKFDTDLTAWKVKCRNDGKAWIKSTLKLGDGANTAVSPFVVLN
jgi:HK97 family phage major capsid protein